MKSFLCTLVVLSMSCALWAAEQTINGVKWTYSLINGGSDVQIDSVPSEIAGAIEIPAEIGGMNVTSIAKSVFWSRTGLTSVIIPSTVTSIGDYAFYGCTKLTLVTIPASVTSIGGKAFTHCNGVSVEKDNLHYSSDSFGVLFDKSKECILQAPEKITEYNIPTSVTSIGEDAFYFCKKLKTVEIPSSVTSIGNDAFGCCEDLTLVAIPPSVLFIGDRTFYGCSSLTSVTIPSSVISIGDSSFRNCSNLTSVTIQEGVTTIEHQAFSGCGRLNSVTIPTSVTSIGFGAFCGCNGVSVVEDNLHYSSDSFGVLFDKTKKNLLQAPRQITEYDIPEGVISIGGDAFSDCSNLTSVTIPTGVTSIGGGAFSDCSNLTSVTIPDTVWFISSDAFSASSAWKTYENGMTFEGPNKRVLIKGPSYSNQWENVIVPNSVTTIADGVFSDAHLSSVELPGSVLTLGQGFCDYSEIERIVLPSSVLEFPSGMFESAKIGEIVIGDLDIISDIQFTVSVNFANNPVIFCPFADWSTVNNLHEQLYPKFTVKSGWGSWDSMDRYWDGAQCLNQENVRIPGNVSLSGNRQSWDGDNTKVKKVYIEDGIVVLPRNFFSYCSALEAVRLPETLRVIRRDAFKKCSSLKQIVVPYGVRYIERGAFPSGVESIVFLEDVPGGGLFSDNNDNYPDIVWVPRQYAGKWRDVIGSKCRIGVLSDEEMMASVRSLSTEMITPKTMAIRYTIDSKTEKNAVRAVAYKDGVKSWSTLAWVKTFTAPEGQPLPDGSLTVTSRDEHEFTWDVAKDWNFALDKVSIALLVNNGSVLPQETVDVPGDGGRHQALTILENSVVDGSQLINALLWHVAASHPKLAVHDGKLWQKENGSETAIADDNGILGGQEEWVITFLYGEMGYRFATAEEIVYAESILRVKFPNKGANRIMVKDVAKNEGK